MPGDANQLFFFLDTTRYRRMDRCLPLPPTTFLPLSRDRHAYTKHTHTHTHTHTPSTQPNIHKLNASRSTFCPPTSTNRVQSPSANGASRSGTVPKHVATHTHRRAPHRRNTAGLVMRWFLGHFHLNRLAQTSLPGSGSLQYSRW
jgi:hypothetical protein